MAPGTLIDISLPIDHRLVLYPGDDPPEIRRLSSISDGDTLTASELRLGCHTGTHVDAPAHFLANGATVAELPLQHFYGPAQVLDFGDAPLIDAGAVEARTVHHGVHLLLRTRNSAFVSEPTFRSDYCHLTPAATEALLASEPLSIGIDYYSLDPPDNEDYPAHRTVARFGIPAFVCLNLGNVPPGSYHFQAFPLNIPGLEGIPVRAILLAR